MDQDYGKATYVAGRHRKNPVLIYTSRIDRSKVYEFMIAAKFKVPGLVSWKCVSCSKIKNGYRNLKVELKRKVPLILVDNDVIKEDPEKPLNAEHFCNGKEAVDAVLSRAKLEFVHRHGDDEPNSARMRETIHSFAREAVTTTPIPLSTKQKRHVEKTLDAGCLPLLHGVKKRRKCKQLKAEETAKPDESEGIDQHQEPESSSSKEKPDEVMKNKATMKEDEAAESPLKRVRRISRQPPAVMVRPLPPYYYTRPPGISQPHPQLHQHSQPHHHHQDHPHQDSIDYYDELTIDGHHHGYHDEDLILADEQDVAYDIELR